MTDLILAALLVVQVAHLIVAYRRSGAPPRPVSAGVPAPAIPGADVHVRYKDKPYCNIPAGAPLPQHIYTDPDFSIVEPTQ